MEITRKIILFFLCVTVILGGSKLVCAKRPLSNALTRFYLVGRNFNFKDDINRRLTLCFENESIMSIENSPIEILSIPRFKETYKYKVDDSLNIIIGSLIQTNKTNKVFQKFISKDNEADTTDGYVLPYRRMEFRSQTEIFPNISGDTIFNFSYNTEGRSDWAEFIQIGYFVFKGDEKIIIDRINKAQKATYLDSLFDDIDGW